MATTSQPNYNSTFFRFLGFVCLVAFSSIFFHGIPLIGSQGLLPASNFMDHLKKHPMIKTSYFPFIHYPTMGFYFSTDAIINVCGPLGMVGGLCLIFFKWSHDWRILLPIWFSFFNIVQIGQVFWSFGWENQLCELLFLSIFLAPTKSLANPAIPRILIEWQTARLMLGAGLIKLRSDPCWMDLSCFDFHFETQPLPSPTSFYWHVFSFNNLDKAGILYNHFVELVIPAIIIIKVVGEIINEFKRLPLIFRSVFYKLGFTTSYFCMLFHFMVLITGNFAYINIVSLSQLLVSFHPGDPMIPFYRMYQRKMVSALQRLKKHQDSIQSSDKTVSGASSSSSSSPVSSPSSSSSSSSPSSPSLQNKPHSQPGHKSLKKSQKKSNKQSKEVTDTVSPHQSQPKPQSRGPSSIRSTLLLCLLFSFIFLSYHPVLNLISDDQVMNKSHDRFRLCNSYGVFGTITRERYELIFSVSNDGNHWSELEFHCKPGNINAQPCISPHFHHRLDWQLWFAAMNPTPTKIDSAWIYPLLNKIVTNPEAVQTFFRSDITTFRYKYVKVDRFLYHFPPRKGGYITPEKSGPDWIEDSKAKISIGSWWYRQYAGNYIKAVDKNSFSLSHYIQSQQKSLHTKRPPARATPKPAHSSSNSGPSSTHQRKTYKTIHNDY